MLKAVLLDVDNTILDFGEASRQTIARGFAEWNLPLTPDVYPVFLQVNSRLWRQIEAGTLTKPELYQLRWNLIFSHVGIQADGPAFEQYFRAGIAGSAVLIDGAEDMMKYLQKKYTVLIASNASYAQQVRRLTAAGLIGYADGIVTSEMVGFSKPQPEFFAECMKRLPGVLPEETVLIGDSPEADIAGAQQYGLKTCWFDYYGNGDNRGIQADYTVTHLRQVQNWI